MTSETPFAGPPRDSTLPVAGIAEAEPILIGSGDEFIRVWIASRGHATMVRIIADELVRLFGHRPRARLIWDEDSDERVLALVAPVRLSPEDAVTALFEFTGSDWWSRMFDATHGEIVVDVECY